MDRAFSRRTGGTLRRKGLKPFGITPVFSDGRQSVDRQGGFDVRALTEAEREYLTETQSLTLDEAGRDVLVGLTYEESSLLMAYPRRMAAGSKDEDPENLTIWLELAERHECARPLQTSTRVLRGLAHELDGLAGSPVG